MKECKSGVVVKLWVVLGQLLSFGILFKKLIYRAVCLNGLVRCSRAHIRQIGCKIRPTQYTKLNKLFLCKLQAV